MMLGLDLVSVRLRNLTLNNVPVGQGEPLFQNGGGCAVGNGAVITQSRLKSLKMFVLVLI